jgi:hypothetical protein
MRARRKLSLNALKTWSRSINKWLMTLLKIVMMTMIKRLMAVSESFPKVSDQRKIRARSRHSRLLMG